MTLILDLDYLNTACFLSLNTDDKKYNMCLKMAQKDLKGYLGAEFYTQIETQYPNYSGDNLTLYDDYIKDYLAWATYYYYLGFSQADATPTGVRQFNDENSSILEDVKLYSYSKNVEKLMVRYRNDMLNYLRETQVNDPAKFPLYDSACKEVFSFGITSIDKKSDLLLNVNKAIINNE